MGKSPRHPKASPSHPHLGDPGPPSARVGPGGGPAQASALADMRERNSEKSRTSRWQGEKQASDLRPQKKPPPPRRANLQKYPPTKSLRRCEVLPETVSRLPQNLLTIVHCLYIEAVPDPCAQGGIWHNTPTPLL